jgi:hypothetical protein
LRFTSVHKEERFTSGLGEERFTNEGVEGKDEEWNDDDISLSEDSVDMHIEEGLEEESV